MIYFLFGPDTYRSRKRVRDIIAAFREKAGDPAPVTRLDLAEAPDALLMLGGTASLFSQKELVVVEHVSRAAKSTEAFILEHAPYWGKDPNYTVIFWDEDVEFEKGSLLENIQKHSAKSQEFGELSGTALRRWIGEEAAKRGVKLSSQEQAALVERVGGDLWMMANELDKMQSGWSEERVRKEVERVWAVADAFFHSPRSSFRPLEALLKNGFEPIPLLATLSGSLRTLTEVWSSLSSGKKVKAKLHPFVVKKNTERARHVAKGDLDGYFSSLVKTDAALKTGELPGSLSLVRLVLARKR